MLLINGVLIFFLVQGPKKEGYGDRRGADVKERISRRLEFNREQESAYFKLAVDHQDKMRDSRNEQKELVKAYFEFLASPDSNVEEQERIIEEIKSLEAQKLSITYQHFEDLKAICNKDQLLKFETVLKDLLPIFSDSPRRPGRRPGP